MIRPWRIRFVAASGLLAEISAAMIVWDTVHESPWLASGICLGATLLGVLLAMAATR